MAAVAASHILIPSKVIFNSAGLPGRIVLDEPNMSFSISGDDLIA